MAAVSRTEQGACAKDLIRDRQGLAEEFTGKLILLLFFLLVAFLIYMLISGKFSNVAGGFEWIG